MIPRAVLVLVLVTAGCGGKPSTSQLGDGLKTGQAVDRVAREPELSSGKTWWCWDGGQGIRKASCARTLLECSHQRKEEGASACRKQAQAHCFPYADRKDEKAWDTMCAPDAKSCARKRDDALDDGYVGRCAAFGDTDVDRASRATPPDRSLDEGGAGWACLTGDDGLDGGCMRSADGCGTVEECEVLPTAFCYSYQDDRARLSCHASEELCLAWRNVTVRTADNLSAMTGCGEVGSK